MPRITSYSIPDFNVSTDLCRDCYRDQIEDKHLMISLYGPGYDTDVEHPDYAEDEYECDACTAVLGAEDN